ncbi:hypothetical protein RRSWK_05363 [Rhodopirellula sp. SWK7]|nr:hypothetical protein RRSWK_05363 [Rhodopirellula sp. SWK7]
MGLRFWFLGKARSLCQWPAVAGPAVDASKYVIPIETKDAATPT